VVHRAAGRSTALLAGQPPRQPLASTRSAVALTVGVWVVSYAIRRLASENEPGHCRCDQPIVRYFLDEDLRRPGIDADRYIRSRAGIAVRLCTPSQADVSKEAVSCTHGTSQTPQMITRDEKTPGQHHEYGAYLALMPATPTGFEPVSPP
jgi:hypothetical protein